MTTNRQMAKIEPYLDGMRAAATATDLETAFQKDKFWHPHLFTSPGWRKITDVLIEEGQRIRDAHPQGHLVPRMSGRNTLMIAGQTCTIGRGGNSTGMRYAWTCAQKWAVERMTEAGLSKRTAHLVWEWWSHYPHRAVRTLDEFANGQHRDPELNVLIRHDRVGGSPIRYSVEENEAGHCRRASRACPCGGTLFDWGGGHSSGFEFVNWHCIACPEVYTEYMTRERFYALRQGTLPVAA